MGGGGEGASRIHSGSDWLRRGCCGGSAAPCATGQLSAPSMDSSSGEAVGDGSGDSDGNEAYGWCRAEAAPRSNGKADE